MTLKLVTEAELDRQAIAEVVEDLRQRVERGEVRGLVIAYLTTDGCAATRTSAGLTFVERLGLMELAKADLIAMVEGGQ